MPNDNLNRHWGVVFPDADNARPDGLLAYGGDLRPITLLHAYSRGIFPWYSRGDPILWWSPDPRCVLFPAQFHISRRSLRKILHSNFYCSIDKAFTQVIEECAGPRRSGGGTWLLPEMIAAYIGLHNLGFAHSVEIWQNGRLAGGIYGVAIGRVFFGESMFHHVSEASRAALCCLVHSMRSRGHILLDCQQASPHMLAMGAREIARQQFVALVQKAAAMPDNPVWRQDLTLVNDFLARG